MMQAAVGVVAGSGLDLTGILDGDARERDFTDFAALANTGVRGHAGRFMCGRCGDVPVIVQQGRLHFYEGLGYAAISRTVDILTEFGARAIIFTNAAGGLLPGMRPGDLLAVDNVRLWPYGPWPGHPEEITPDFVVGGCDWRGTYHWVHGPCYETRAEIAALRRLKSSVVGMSTAAEMARARDLGIRAAAVSCITNNCCTPQVLTHEHVLRTAGSASARLCELLRSAVAHDFYRVEKSAKAF
jgi:purine-nucleoside phosphorylase